MKNVIKRNKFITGLNEGLLGMAIWTLFGLKELPTYITILKSTGIMSFYLGGKVEKKAASMEFQTLLDIYFYVEVLSVLVYSLGNAIAYFNPFIGLVMLCFGRTIYAVREAFESPKAEHIKELLGGTAVKDRADLQADIKIAERKGRIIGTVANTIIVLGASRVDFNPALVQGVLLIIHALFGFVDLYISYVERNMIYEELKLTGTTDIWSVIKNTF